MSFKNSLINQLNHGVPVAIAHAVALAVQPTADIEHVLETRLPDFRLVYPTSCNVGEAFKAGIEYPYL